MARRTRADRRHERQLRSAGKIVPPRTPKSKRASKGKDASPQRAPSPITDERGPTAERAAKHDLDLERSPLQDKIGGGAETRVYRSPPPIERMRNMNRLDHRPEMNEAMYQQAIDLQRLYRKGGMIGIAAQDLTRAFGGGSSDPPYMTPRTESAAAARGEMNQRLNFLGLKTPHGFAHVVYAVVCEEMSFTDAGRLYCHVNNDHDAAAVAKHHLRCGLMTLVDLSRMKHRPALSRVLGQTVSMMSDA